MPIPVRCPSCEHAFRVPDQYAGKRGKCPKCKSIFVAEPAADDTAEFPVAASEEETALASSGAKTVALPKPKLLAKVTGEPEAAASRTTTSPKLKSAEPLKKAAPPASAPPPAAPPAARPAVAKATDTKATATISTTTISTSTSASGAVYAHRRKKKSNALPVIVVGGIGLLVLLGVGGLVAWSLQTDLSLTANAQQDPNSNAVESDASAPPPPAVLNASNPSSGDGAQLANWNTLEKSLVDISVIDHAGDTRTGRGVIVDARGWVATSYTLAQGATAAVATFADGRRLEFIGVLAERPRHNLALWQLDVPADGPAEFPALQIAGQWTPEPGERVFLGTLAQAQPTTISGDATAQSIPAGSRARLPNAAREEGGLRLVVHGQQIADEQDGTPLLLTNGKLAAICTAMGATRKGYAMPASPLVEMLAAAEPSKVASFTESAPMPLPAQPQPPEETDQPFAQLQATVDLLARSGWTPESPEHYEAFQLLAASLDAMQSIVDASAGDLAPERRQRREQLQEMIQTTLTEIAAAGMPDEAEQTRVNRIAVPAIDTASEQGVYLYVKCVMQPSDFGERSVDGEPGFAFEIVGTDELLVMGVGIPENGRQIELGSRWLLLGVVNPKERYRMLRGDGREPREAFVVRSKYLFGE